jgi:hypothetical protein
MNETAIQAAATSIEAQADAAAAATQSSASTIVQAPKPPAAPGTRPGSTAPSASSVDPDTFHILTLAATQTIGKADTLSIDWAGTYNDEYAHYDLGAGGRGVTADCHDASDAAGNEYSSPHCWTGVHLKAFQSAWISDSKKTSIQPHLGMDASP